MVSPDVFRILSEGASVTNSSGSTREGSLVSGGQAGPSQQQMESKRGGDTNGAREYFWGSQNTIFLSVRGSG